jgi:predicted secreted hydrolase
LEARDFMALSVRAGERRATLLVGGLFLALAVAAGAWLWRQSASPDAPTGGRTAEAEFLRVLRDAESRFPDLGPAASLSFPADHGAHPRAASESWEIAGWLRDETGRDQAFRLSFARVGWLPDPPVRPSAWAAAAAYRGLFALADANGAWFRERFGRAALGIAGFDPAARRLWLDDWSLKVPAAPDEAFSLAAAGDAGRLELRLRGTKPPVAADSGEGARLRGYFASRLDAEGSLTLGGKARPVAGSAWLDHAWGRLLPPGGQVALDRFRLQLDDGRDLVIYRLRRRDGSAEPLNRGLLVDAAGRAEALEGRDIRLEPQAFWRSPATGNRYPVSFRLALPGRGLELRLAPLVEGQEIEGAATGWNGAVRATGSAAGKPLAGRGFLDLGG